MIIRSIVILSIGIGYPPSLVANVEANPTENHAYALYAAYRDYNRKEIEKLIDQGTDSRAKQLEQACTIAVAKPDAATAVDIQNELIEAKKKAGVSAITRLLP